MLVEREGKIVDMVYPLGLSPEGMYPKINTEVETSTEPLIFATE
jgi:hypothetical protein